MHYKHTPKQCNKQEQSGNKVVPSSHPLSCEGPGPLPPIDATDTQICGSKWLPSSGQCVFRRKPQMLPRLGLWVRDEIVSWTSQRWKQWNWGVSGLQNLDFLPKKPWISALNREFETSSCLNIPEKENLCFVLPVKLATHTSSTFAGAAAFQWNASKTQLCTNVCVHTCMCMYMRTCVVFGLLRLKKNVFVVPLLKILGLLQKAHKKSLTLSLFKNVRKCFGAFVCWATYQLSSVWLKTSLSQPLQKLHH